MLFLCYRWTVLSLDHLSEQLASLNLFRSSILDKYNTAHIIIQTVEFSTLAHNAF